MNRLPKKLEKYLSKIAKHDAEPNYIKNHFESMPFQDIWDEMVLMEGLYDRGLIDCQGEKIEIAETAESPYVISYKPTFVLSSEAKLYLEDLNKYKLKQYAKIAFSIITALGSCAAITNLILYVMWH